MDIALEFVDTYAFDRLYAAVLPASPAPYNLKGALGNGTSFDASSSPWQYEPASQYISFQPGEAAYSSQWDRNNVYRQIISLYFITW
jgi:lathosterol oxidase